MLFICKLQCNGFSRLDWNNDLMFDVLLQVKKECSRRPVGSQLLTVALPYAQSGECETWKANVRLQQGG